MRRRGINKGLSVGATAFFLVLVTGLSALAAEQAGRITEMEGSVRIMRADGEVEIVGLNSEVYVGDLVQTSRVGRCTILFLDESLLNLSPNTQIKIDEMVYKPEESYRSSIFNLITGTVKGVVGGWFSDDEDLSKYEVKTPTAVAGVRGTSFVATVTTDPDGTRSTTIAGLSGGMIAVWALIDPQGRIYLMPNQFSIIKEGQLPTNPMIITDDMLRDLMESLIYINTSLEDRAKVVRDTLGMRRVRIYLTPEALANLMQTAMGPANTEDDPSKLIFQEPPPFTPVIIRVQPQ